MIASSPPLRPITIFTPRLHLRPWRESDYPAFAALNTDARVRQFFYAPADTASSMAMAQRFQRRIEQHGYGFWAIEHRDSATCIGFAGLSPTYFSAHFTPAIEIAWRVAPDFWGHGYASEAAKAVLEDGFTRVQLAEIIAYTLPANAASRRVAEKIGMRRDPTEDFDHPDIPPGDPKCRMVLYRARPSR